MNNNGFNALRVDGIVALVTGANRGIGRETVVALLERGAQKVYAGTRNTEQLADLVAGYGDRVVPVQLDITSHDDVKAAASVASDVSLLVNNAGAVFGALNDWSAGDEWFDAGQKEIEVNAFGTHRVTQAFLPILAANGGGAVVNLNSVASLVNFPMFASYSVAKAALHSITQATRLFAAQTGTFVAEVFPGPVDTDMAKDIPFEKTSPSDVAHAILDGIEAGEEDIFPDGMSEQFGALFLSDPKALERQVAGMVAQPA